MMKSVLMKAQLREGIGKGVSRKLRATGKVPGILYGHGMKSVALFVDEKGLSDLVDSISIENTLVDLLVEGYRKKPMKALIRELQHHHFLPRIIHVDFFQVSLKEKIHVEIPVVLLGIASGVKNFGGVLEHHLRDISISCLPTDIPEKVEIDVSALNIGDSVRVKDVRLSNVEILNDPEQPVATVIPPTVMKEAVPAAAAAPEEAVTEPEVIGESKRAEKKEAEEGKGKPEREGKSKEGKSEREGKSKAEKE
jgi:large subunit ribosomal protein L25